MCERERDKARPGGGQEIKRGQIEPKKGVLTGWGYAEDSLKTMAVLHFSKSTGTEKPGT